MKKVVRFANRKYFVPFDNTDNPSCWQVGCVGRDIDALLAEFGIDSEAMYEDWGAAWSWFSNGVEHSMHLECTSVDEAEYQVSYFALKPKWLFLKADASDDESDFRKVIPRLRQLGIGPA